MHGPVEYGRIYTWGSDLNYRHSACTTHTAEHACMHDWQMNTSNIFRMSRQNLCACMHRKCSYSLAICHNTNAVHVSCAGAEWKSIRVYTHTWHFLVLVFMCKNELILSAYSRSDASLAAKNTTVVSSEEQWEHQLLNCDAHELSCRHVHPQPPTHHTHTHTRHTWQTPHSYM